MRQGKATHIRALRIMVLLAAGVSLVACATRSAPEYGGRWKAVNRFAEQPQEIPLYQSYEFYAAPLDRTLKAMLERWARDTGKVVSYLHSSDFTLHAAAARIRSSNVEEAVAQLSVAYADQGIQVTVDGNKIVVRSADQAAMRTSVGDEALSARH